MMLDKRKEDKGEKFFLENKGLHITFFIFFNIMMLLLFVSNFGLSGLIGCALALLVGSPLVWQLSKVPLIVLYCIEPSKTSK